MREGRSFTVDVAPDGEGLVSHAGAALLAETADRVGLTRELSRALARDRPAPPSLPPGIEDQMPEHEGAQQKLAALNQVVLERNAGPRIAGPSHVPKCQPGPERDRPGYGQQQRAGREKSADRQ